MKITPLDIQKKTFRTALRGLDPDEVDAFLDLVAGELEAVIKENIALKEEVRRQGARLAEYEEREKVLQETLMTAQKITQDIKEQARKESEIFLADAKVQAERIVQDAHRRLVELIADINELKRERARFRAELRHLIESHRAVLDSFDEEIESKSVDRIRENVEFLAPQAARTGTGEGET